MFKFNKLSGQVSRLLLVLAVVVLVAVILTFLIMKMAEKPVAPKPNPIDQVPLPVYEATLGNIRFVFQSAIDRGAVLKASDVVSSQYTFNTQKDQNVSPGGKFIQVTVGAQNVGTMNTVQGAWDIENIVDSENRNFVPLDQYTIAPWIPTTSSCGVLLKPAFSPLPCTKIYEVSKESTGLKIRVETGKNNAAISSGNATFDLLDLIVK